MDAVSITPRDKARRRHAAAVGAMQWPTMLTLTRENLKGPLTVARLRDTMRAFARLRRTKPFRDVRGGIAAIEATQEANGWHDHIHAIVDAKWLDIQPMAKAWTRALRALGSIHIQRLNQRQKALAYITKPPNPCQRATELEAAMSAPHLTTAWGTCRK